MNNIIPIETDLFAHHKACSTPRSVYMHLISIHAMMCHMDSGEAVVSSDKVT